MLGVIKADSFYTECRGAQISKSDINLHLSQIVFPFSLKSAKEI